MKKKMVTIYSPVAEEETAYNEGTFYNVVEPSFEVSRILSFENTVDILEKLRCAGGRDGQNVTHEENHLHYYDSHFSNNMHLSHSYSHNRSAELDFGNQTKERRSSDIGVSNFHSWYDVDFNEPSYEQQHNYSADLYTPSADDRRLPKKYSGMVEAVEKDGTVVPHVLVESRSLMPQIMTPLSPENPKSLKEHHSLLAMSAHMENLGINVNHGISNGYYLNHGRVAKQPHHSARSRFKSVPNLTTDFYASQGHTKGASSNSLPQCPNETDPSSISYEELRNSIIDKFTSKPSYHEDDDEEYDDYQHFVDNNKLNAGGPAAARSADIIPNKSVLKQMLDDKCLMDAISKKQKRGAYKCAHCPEMFNTVFEFARHIDQYKVERKYKCPFPLCPWKILGLPKLHELKRHCVNQHNDELSPELQYLISGKRGPISHVYQCEAPFCDKTFHRKDSYRRHVMMVHDNSKSRFNIRLNKALSSCPDQLKHDPLAREQYLSEKMKHRRKHRH